MTVMNERGAPTPVAWTRLRAPESLMGPADPAAMQATVAASPRYAKYATVLDRDSAHEMLTVKVEEGARRAAEEAAAKEREKAAKEAAKSSGRSTSRRTSTKDEAASSRTSSSPAPSRTSCVRRPARSLAGCSGPPAAGSSLSCA